MNSVILTYQLFLKFLELFGIKNVVINVHYLGEQIIDYINRSINFIEKKVQNPQYFIWTNDYEDFDQLSNRLIT